VLKTCENFDAKRKRKKRKKIDEKRKRNGSDSFFGSENREG
jgi:hypothetical protein